MRHRPEQPVAIVRNIRLDVFTLQHSGPTGGTCTHQSPTGGTYAGDASLRPGERPSEGVGQSRRLFQINLMTGRWAATGPWKRTPPPALPFTECWAHFSDASPYFGNNKLPASTADTATSSPAAWEPSTSSSTDTTRFGVWNLRPHLHVSSIVCCARVKWMQRVHCEATRSHRSTPRSKQCAQSSAHRCRCVR